MKGSNDLILNEATMIEAVQFWLDSMIVPPAPQVTGVKSHTENYGKTFMVSLNSESERDDGKKAPQ